MINLRLTASVKSPMSPMQLKNWRTHHLIFLTVNVLSFFLLLADKPLTHMICLWFDNEYERCHQYWLTNLAWAQQKRANVCILNTSNRILINKKNYFWFPFILNRVGTWPVNKMEIHTIFSLMFNNSSRLHFAQSYKVCSA